MHFLFHFYFIFLFHISIPFCCTYVSKVAEKNSFAQRGIPNAIHSLDNILLLYNIHWGITHLLLLSQQAQC